MITDAIVATSVLLTLAFAAVWLLRPDLRAWIEQPKHHFQDHVDRYDRERTGQARPPVSPRP
jgi:hypothetical protein